MQLNREGSNAKYQIKKYTPGCVTINDQEFHSSVIIMPEYLAPWTVANFAELTVDQLNNLVELKPSVILIGTGEKQVFLPTDLLQSVASRGIGIEVMTTAAACRTYTILVSEHRNVLAALVI